MITLRPVCCGISRRQIQRALLSLLCGVSVGSFPIRAGLVFENGFEGGAAEWAENGAWEPVPANARVATISREGEKAVSIIPVADGIRSELVIKDGSGEFHWGTEYWVGLSVQVVVPTGGFRIICQHHAKPHLVDGKPDWKAGAGGNSFTIMIAGNDFDIRTQTDPRKVMQPPGAGATQGTVSVKSPFVVKQWYDFVLHFRLATDDTGIMQVWKTDAATGVTVQLVDVTAGPTVYLYDRSGVAKATINYQKFGTYYGEGSAAVGGEILYDAVRIWTGPGGSREAVAPGRNRLK